MTVAPSWTDDEREQVGVWLLEGKSMGRISKLLGVTRNVVIGRVHRDGTLHAFIGRVVVEKKIAAEKPVVEPKRKLPPVKPIEPTRHWAPPPRSFMCEAVEAEAVPVIIEDDAVQAFVPLLELRPGDCRWPIAEIGLRQHYFCGLPKAGDFTRYCAMHYRRSVAVRA